MMSRYLLIICSEKKSKAGTIMIVFQILSFIFWLMVIPFGIGLLPVILMPKQERSAGTVFLSGYLLLFALFELLGIPVVIFKVYHGYSTLVILFAVVSVLLAAGGIGYSIIAGKKGYRLTLSMKENGREYSLEDKLYFILFLLIVGFQIYMSVTKASFDGDDSYYVVQGVIAQQKDTLYRINPNTGSSFPLDARHALALIPIWEAFIGTMSSVHATVIAHSIVPPVLLCLTYLVYYKIGQKLFEGKKDRLPVFMVLIALFQLFGNVSIYTNETFLLTRTWQGKSVAGNLILPAVFWIFFCLFVQGQKERKKSEEAGYWLLLAGVNLAAGVSSSLAVMLSALLVAGLAFLFMIKERKFSILVKAGFACIPSALYVLVYLLISR